MAKKQISTCPLAIILVLNILMGLSFWPIVDSPQALSDPIKKELKVTTPQISNFYTVYSITNLFAAPLGGLVANRFGIGNTGLLVAIFSFMGTVINFLGIEYKSYALLVVGRAVFSIAGETLMVVQASISEKWFSGRILSIALGLNTTFGLVFGSASNYSEPLMFVRFRDLKIPYLYMVVASFFGFVAYAFFNVMELCYEPVRNDKPLSDSPHDPHEDLIKLGNEDGKTQSGNVKFSLGDLKRMGPLFWATIAIYTILANAYYQITFILTDFAMHRFYYPYLEAKNSLSIVQISTIVSLPLFSFISYKYGKKSILMFISVIILLAAYIMMYFLRPKESYFFYICLSMLGIFYSMYSSCIWPAMALAIPKDAVSVGYSISSLSQNVVMFILPPIIGRLTVDNTIAEYDRALLVCIGMCIIGVCLMIYVLVLDFKHGGLLHHPENSEECKMAKEKIDEEFRKGKRKERKRGRRGIGGKKPKDSIVSYGTLGHSDRESTGKPLGK